MLRPEGGVIPGALAAARVAACPSVGLSHVLPVVVATNTSEALSFASDLTAGRIPPYLILQAVDQKELYNLFFKLN